MLFVHPAYAVNICDVWRLCPKGTGTNNTGAGSLAGLISYFLPKALLVAGIIFFFLIIFAGIGIISNAGGGDPHAMEKGKAFLTYAIIGLVIIFGAYFVLQIINFVTGGSLSGLLGF